MAATVTIDKVYFETLLRRAEFHTSGRDLTTPVDIPIVSIPKVDHDNLVSPARNSRASMANMRSLAAAYGTRVQSVSPLHHRPGQNLQRLLKCPWTKPD